MPIHPLADSMTLHGRPLPPRAVALAACLACALPPVLAQSDGGDAQTVTVTSVRKKLEVVQDVPATVSVLSGADLAAAGVNDVRGIEYKIPGLVLGDKGFDGASIGIRGASSIRGYTGDEAAVAVHLDGIYVPQSGAALGRLFDVARVETLFGPQGSLYGRNAVAGVVDIVSNAPAKTFGGGAQVSRSSFNTTTVEGVLNVPLNEAQGLRFALYGARGDGYVKNVLDGRTAGNDDFTAGRLRYAGLWGAVQADLTLQVSKDDSLPARRPKRLDDAAALTQGIGFYQTAVDTNEYSHRKDTNLALKLTAALGDLSLRSITGWTTYSLDVKFDTELNRAVPPIGLASLGYQESKAWSQEFSLASSGDNTIDWRAGVYFTGTKVKENRKNDDTASSFADGVTGYDDLRLWQDGSARAVFGTVEWKPVPAVSVALGLRYNSETKEQSQNEVWGVVPPSGTIPLCSETGGGALFCRSADTRKFTWNGASGDLTLKWQLSKQTHAYVRAARGFRSGAVGGLVGIDNGIDQLFGGPGTFGLSKLKPETLDSVELGTKNSLLGGRLLLNAAYYHNVYKDMLVFTSDPVTLRIIEGNLGKTVTQGLDLNGAWVPDAHWRLDASLNYSEGKITEVGPIAIGVAVGNKPTYAPRVSAALALGYRTNLAGGKLGLNVEANHKDKVYFDLANHHEQGAVDLFNLNANWDAPGGHWRVFFAVNNVTGKEYVTYAQPSSSPRAFATPGAPRTVRVGAGLRF